MFLCAVRSVKDFIHYLFDLVSRDLGECSIIEEGSDVSLSRLIDDSGYTEQRVSLKLTENVPLSALSFTVWTWLVASKPVGKG